MPHGYFHRVNKETKTRMWINNPSLWQVEQAICAGAINCTTNPAFCSKLVDSAPAHLRAIINRVLPEVAGDDAAAERVYQLSTMDINELFLPLYEESEGAYGYVTKQGDPRRDDDADAIIKEALRDQLVLGRNFMAKIPVTVAGAEAIEYMVSKDIPVCATEIFGLAQAIYVCERYQRAATRTGNHPPFYVTHISGIFDEYLGLYAKEHKVEIAPEVLSQAGCAIARAEYRLMKQRGYDGIMLGGGARGLSHFTEMVGGDMHITINWKEIRLLLEANEPAAPRMDAEVNPAVIEELSAKLPDFRRGIAEDGLAPQEFASFGPLVLFRNSFIKGYEILIKEIAAARKA